MKYTILRGNKGVRKSKRTNYVCSNYKEYILKHIYFTFTI